MNETIYLLNLLKDFKNHCEKYKNSFFWSSNGNANKRRNDEDKAEFPKYSFEFEGDIFEISSSATVSCNNFYFSKTITKNGEKKDIREINKIINKLENL
jgi:hypothetical protein